MTVSFVDDTLVATAPINGALAIVTYLDVGRPLLFRQERAGKNGVQFTIVKFRNMTNEVDERGELLPADQRVTKWGAFVRRTSLDELLNLWCVLKGDMSIIGPRPLLLEYTDRYCDYHRARLSVNPVLECPPNPRLDDANGWESRFNNDVWYVEHVSLKTDLKKLVRFFEAVLNRKTTKVRGEAGLSCFMGYREDGVAVSMRDLNESFVADALGRPTDGQ